MWISGEGGVRLAFVYFIFFGADCFFGAYLYWLYLFFCLGFCFGLD